MERLLRCHRASTSDRHRRPRSYFEIADRTDLSYQDKLACYRRLADEYFDTDRYARVLLDPLDHVDEMVHDWVRSADFDDLLVGTVRGHLPARTSTNVSSPISAD